MPYIIGIMEWPWNFLERRAQKQPSSKKYEITARCHDKYSRCLKLLKNTLTLRYILHHTIAHRLFYIPLNSIPRAPGNVQYRESCK